MTGWCCMQGCGATCMLQVKTGSQLSSKGGMQATALIWQQTHEDVFGCASTSKMAHSILMGRLCGAVSCVLTWRSVQGLVSHMLGSAEERTRLFRRSIATPTDGHPSGPAMRWSAPLSTVLVALPLSCAGHAPPHSVQTQPSSISRDDGHKRA